MYHSLWAGPLAWNRRIVNVVRDAGNTGELHGDVLGDLAAELNCNAPDLHIRNRKRGARRRGEHGSKSLSGSAPKDLKPACHWQIASQTESGDIEMIDV